MACRDDRYTLAVLDVAAADHGGGRSGAAGLSVGGSGSDAARGGQGGFGAEPVRGRRAMAEPL